MNCADDMGVTGNAVLLLGYIAGALSIDAPAYRMIEIDTLTGVQIFEHGWTKNTYRVSVVQLTGTV